MRFLLASVILVVGLGLIAFTVNNVGTQVPVTLLQTHSDIELYIVVWWAFLMGSLTVAIIAVAEGAVTRLSNRRLRREVHKLETEVNYLRTQPRSPRPEAQPTAASQRTSSTPDQPAKLPSAPVYEPEADNTTTDPDDDIYTGGRAV